MLTSALVISLGLHAFAMDPERGEIPNGYAKEPTDPQVLVISIISPKKAKSLFRQFINSREIPFGAAHDSCYARASAMALMAESHQILMGKIVAIGLMQAMKQVIAPREHWWSWPEWPYQRWGFHLATVVYIRQPKGPPLLMVFDPAIDKEGPLLVDDWKRKLEFGTSDYPAKVSHIYYGARFQYKHFEEEKKSKFSWESADLADMRARLAQDLLEKGALFPPMPSPPNPEDL